MKEIDWEDFDFYEYEELTKVKTTNDVRVGDLVYVKLRKIYREDNIFDCVEEKEFIVGKVSTLEGLSWSFSDDPSPFYVGIEEKSIVRDGGNGKVGVVYSQRYDTMRYKIYVKR